MTPFIGIGTGRCGTQSLARIVAACKKTVVSHENYKSDWYKAEAPIEKMIDAAKRAQRNGSLFGEVSCHLLPHVPMIASKIPGLKIIVMQRDMDGTVDSLLRWCKGRDSVRPLEQIRLHNSEEGFERRLAGRFPLIDAADSKQAWEFYFQMYASAVEYIRETFPVKVMDMDELNGDLDDLFDYLDIPAANRRYPEERVYNSFEEKKGSKRMEAV